MRLAMGGAVFAAILAMLELTRAVGLYDDHLPLFDIAASIGLAATLRDRLIGPFATAAAYGVASWAMGHQPLQIVLQGLAYGAGCWVGAMNMRGLHKIGFSATLTCAWLGLLLGAFSLAATVVAVRLVEGSIIPSHHAEPLTILAEMMANLVGVMAGMSIIINMREWRELRVQVLGNILLVAFLFSQVMLFWFLLNHDLGFASRAALVMVAGLPAAMIVAIYERSLGVAVISTLWAAACFWLVLDYAGHVYNSEFLLIQMYQTALFICSQMIHVVNRDRIVALSLNRDQTAELERRVVERTAKLEAMTARAMAADEAKSEFLAVMSHELRTPMNGVLGMSELLRQSGVTDRQRVFLDVIRSSSQALLTIISDILEFSRIEAGRLEINEAPFETAEIAGDYITPLALEADAKGVEIVVRLDPALPRRIISDAGRLRQLCINLLGNAVKFTAHGRITMDIAQAADPGGAPILRIELRDTGPGVPLEQRETIFEKFSQGDGTATRRSGGSGLGLSICRGIAELMAGRVGVDPRPGGGSVFWFEAPLRPADKTGETVADALPRCAPDGYALILDPDRAQVAILKELLEQAGVQVVIGAAREEASALLRPGAAPLFVALGDAAGDADGAAAVTALRAAAGVPELPVALLISPGDIENERHFAPDLRNLALLVKPLRAPAVIEALRQLCAQAHRIVPAEKNA